MKRSCPLTPCTSKDIEKLNKYFDMRNTYICPYCDGVFGDTPTPTRGILYCSYCRGVFQIKRKSIAERFEDFVFNGVK